MFSKLNPKLSISSPADSTRSTAPLSIAAKLTLWHTLCGSVLLVAATTLLYWTLAHSLTLDEDEFLSGRLRIFAKLLAQSAETPAEVVEAIARESGSDDPPRIYIRVFDGQGSVVGESPGMAELLPSWLFPAPFGVGPSGIKLVNVNGLSGRPFRAATTLLPSTDASVLHVIQVAYDWSDDEAVLSIYRYWMVAILLTGVLLLTFATWIIARRELQPIAKLTDIVRQIGTTHMQFRVGQVHWPRELTDLTRNFDAMLDRLEEEFRRLDRFSADIAHELRTPLNILRGETEVTLTHTRSPEEYRTLLASSLEEYDRLGRLLDSLLFLAHAERPEAKIEKKKLNGRSEALAVCEFYEALAAERGIAMGVSGEAEIFADPMLLRRALSNLLSNALRYTGAGGQVRICLRTGPAGSEIDVTDSGAGIGPEHLPYIFDRFYRADAARVRNTDGSGLGLAIVKSIMALHGGAVSITSEPGRGTTATLTFP